MHIIPHILKHLSPLALEFIVMAEGAYQFGADEEGADVEFVGGGRHVFPGGGVDVEVGGFFHVGEGA